MRLNQLTVWAGISLICIVNLLIRGLLLLNSPATLQVQYVPDDAFYYLTLARNFNQIGFWSFDLGTSVTSGFHPLFAYSLALIEQLAQPSPDAFLQWGIAFSVIVTLMAAGAAWWVCLRHGKTLLLFCLAVICSGAIFTYLSTAVLEWGLALIFAVLYIQQFQTVVSGSNGWRPGIALFLLGFIGSLARSDFGLLPAACFGALLMVDFYKHRRLNVFPSMWGVGGAVIGTAAVLLHSYLFTGNFLQSSARVKAYWALHSDSDYYLSLKLIPRVLGLDIDPDLFVIGLLLGSLPLLILYLKARIQRKKPIKPTRYGVIFTLVGLMAVVAYVLVYSRNGEVQPWYTTNLIIPVFLLLSALLFVASSMLSTRVRSALSIVALVIIVVRLISNNSLSTMNAPWSWQREMYDVGLQLNTAPLPGRVGTWNAGIIGYYSGGRVINLDGLVNDSVYDYITQNQLPAYINSQNIRYLVDFEAMFTEPSYAIRGGYNEPAFLESLQEQPLLRSDQPIDNPSPRGQLILYAVLPP